MDLWRRRPSLGETSASRCFFEPEIDHFVMAITAAEAMVRHTAPHQTT
jgi:hypothetical protein